MTIEELSYALTKQVPEIYTSAVFETNYGTLRLDSADSAKVAELVEKLLRKKLWKAAPTERKRVVCSHDPVRNEEQGIR